MVRDLNPITAHCHLIPDEVDFFHLEHSNFFIPHNPQVVREVYTYANTRDTV